MTGRSWYRDSRCLAGLAGLVLAGPMVAQEVSGRWKRKTEPDRINSIRNDSAPGGAEPGSCKATFTGRASHDDPLGWGSMVSYCYLIDGFSLFGKAVAFVRENTWRGVEKDKPGYHYECWEHTSRCYNNEDGILMETFGEAEDAGQLTGSAKAQVYGIDDPTGRSKAFVAGYAQFESTLESSRRIGVGAKRELRAGGLPSSIEFGTGGVAFHVPLISSGPGVGRSEDNEPPLTHDQPWTETAIYSREHRNHFKVVAKGRGRGSRGSAHCDAQLFGKNESSFSLREQERVKLY